MERYNEYKNSGNYIVGSIPYNWGMVRLKFICTGFNNGTTANQIDYADNTVPVTRIETISNGVVNFNKVGFVEYNDNLDSYKLKRGDVLLSHINSYERVGNSAVYDSDVDLYHGMNLLRLSPKENINNKYLYIYLKSLCFILQMQRKCKPAINQVSVPAKVIKNIFVTYPPLAEQEKIVSYLESKTSKIDAYVEDKEKEIQLLQELKQKTIAEAVTKGLNPDVKMKDSGISWLGMIPEHWEMKQLRSFLSLFTEKGHGDAQLLSVTREQGVILRDKDNKEENHNFVPEDLSGYKYIEKGDFAINKMKAWQGSYAVSDYNGIVSPAYFTCKLKGVNKDFFSRAIRSKAYIPFFTQYSKGIRVDQWDLNPNALKSIPFLLPPVDEQQAIVAYIEEKCQKIDTLITELQAEIDYLKEYKQRLIADVVTGQVNVQNETI